jgi:hypothetical protein
MELSLKHHILGHNVRLNKYNKIYITFCILSDHIGIKLDINSKRNYRKYSNTWRLNNALLNEIKEIRGNVKKILE